MQLKQVESSGSALADQIAVSHTSSLRLRYTAFHTWASNLSFAPCASRAPGNSWHQPIAHRPPFRT